VTLVGSNGDIISTTTDCSGAYTVNNAIDTLYILTARREKVVVKQAITVTPGTVNNVGEANLYTTAQVLLYEKAIKLYPGNVSIADAQNFVPTNELLNTMKGIYAECEDVTCSQCLDTLLYRLVRQLFGSPTVSGEIGGIVIIVPDNFPEPEPNKPAVVTNAQACWVVKVEKEKFGWVWVVTDKYDVIVTATVNDPDKVGFTYTITMDQNEPWPIPDDHIVQTGTVSWNTSTTIVVTASAIGGNIYVPLGSQSGWVVTDADLGQLDYLGRYDNWELPPIWPDAEVTVTVSSDANGNSTFESDEISTETDEAHGVSCSGGAEMCNPAPSPLPNVPVPSGNPS